MATKTFVQKSLLSDVKKTHTSRQKANRISRAIVMIDTVPVETLCRTGKAKKVLLQGKDNLYMYRAGNRERILFSIEGSRNVIHDVIDATEIQALKRRQQKDLTK